MAGPGPPAIIVFARHPTPGSVKSRLARTVGKEKAARLYKLLAERIITAASRVGKGACYLFYSKGEEREAVTRWLEPLQLGELEYEAQLQSEDLGERMAHALRHVQREGHSRALLVGTDVPDLTAAVLQAALAALQTYQVVFGAAEDGGFYLLGLGAPLPGALFQGIAWSTGAVLARNVSNAQGLGLVVAPLETLPTLADIDTEEDLRRWLGRSGVGGGDQMPHPLTALAEELLWPAEVPP